MTIEQRLYLARDLCVVATFIRVALAKRRATGKSAGQDKCERQRVEWSRVIHLNLLFNRIIVAKEL